jgi:hypothetical protein
MKKLSLFSLLGILSMTIIFLFQISKATAYPSGSPAGYTGSPGDGQHCQSCHGGNNSTVNGWITSNIPSQGYTPGTTYTITATASGTGKKGFEVSPQSQSGAQLGTLAAGTGSHLVGGSKYVTQNSSGASGSTVSWTFSWTAPPAGTGSVVFYGAFTVGKPNTRLSTLEVQENVALPLAVTAVAVPDHVCAGQTVQLEAAASGGSGNYTYQWSSNPPGFTSTLHNPVANPEVTTTYMVEVSDGAGTAGTSVQVTVQPPVSVNAGFDTLCSSSVVSVPCHGVAQNFQAVEWITGGSGVFNDPTSPECDYTPSQADKDAGQVELILKALPVPPCTLQSQDARVVRFEGPSGIINTGQNSSGVVFPNPTDGYCSVRTDGHGGVGIEVSDLHGNLVYRKNIDVSGETQVSLDLSGLANGLYSIQVKGADFVKVSRLIKY